MTMPIPTEAGAPLEPITRGPIERPQIARFAAATGDFNPIHTDEAFARKVGFPSVIAHGPLTLAFLTQALGRNFGPEKVRAVTAQFRAPILPGDTLRV
jgi:acyl dehydratase